MQGLLIRSQPLAAAALQSGQACLPHYHRHNHLPEIIIWNAHHRTVLHPLHLGDHPFDIRGIHTIPPS